MNRCLVGRCRFSRADRRTLFHLSEGSRSEEVKDRWQGCYPLVPFSCSTESQLGNGDVDFEPVMSSRILSNLLRRTENGYLAVSQNGERVESVSSNG